MRQEKQEMRMRRRADYDQDERRRERMMLQPNDDERGASNCCNTASMIQQTPAKPEP